MLSGRMLPIHFPPAPDEILSSWYVRLAHANSLKAETFGTVLWGREHQLWNRDIDRWSPEWLVEDLAARTGISKELAWQTTLKSFEGKLFPELHPTGISPWILPVQMYHRKHKWPGIQFCPECLKEDGIPYFRKRWRLAIYAKCHRHNVLCLDRCPSCDEPVMFHRRELGKTNEFDAHPLALCYHCNYDLRESKIQTPPYYGKISENLARITRWLEDDSRRLAFMDIYNVLHHTCKLLVSGKIGHQLQSTIIEKMESTDPVMLPVIPTAPKRAFFEHCHTTMRHQILGCAYWLLSDPKNFSIALRTCNARINYLYKDLDKIPKWYRLFITKLPHRDIPKLR